MFNNNSGWINAGVGAGNIYANDSIDVKNDVRLGGFLKLKENKLSTVGQTLYFNGSAIAGAGNVTNVGDWSLFPAKSTVELNEYDISNIGNVNLLNNVSLGGSLSLSNNIISTNNNNLFFNGNIITTGVPLGPNIWSSYPALTDVNINSKNLNAVSNINVNNVVLNGSSIRSINNNLYYNGNIITTGVPPNPNIWATYPAITDVNVNNKNLNNVSNIYVTDILLNSALLRSINNNLYYNGNIVATGTLPNASVWSTYPALTDVNINSKNINGISNIAVNGNISLNGSSLTSTSGNLFFNGSIVNTGGFTGVSTVNNANGAISIVGDNSTINVSTVGKTLTLSALSSSPLAQSYRYIRIMNQSSLALGPSIGTIMTQFYPYGNLKNSANVTIPSPINAVNSRVSGTLSLTLIFLSSANMIVANSAIAQFQVVEGTTENTNIMTSANFYLPTFTNGVTPDPITVSVPFIGGFSNGATPNPICTLYGRLFSGTNVSFTAYFGQISMVFNSCIGTGLN